MVSWHPPAYDFTKTPHIGVDFLYRNLDSAALPGDALLNTALLPPQNDSYRVREWGVASAAVKGSPIARRLQFAAKLELGGPKNRPEPNRIGRGEN